MNDPLNPGRRQALRPLQFDDVAKALARAYEAEGLCLTPKALAARALTCHAEIVAISVAPGHQRALLHQLKALARIMARWSVVMGHVGGPEPPPDTDRRTLRLVDC